jgi:single-stranded-DNA-specific exonuclease RecJ
LSKTIRENGTELLKLMRTGSAEWIFKTIDYENALPLSEKLGITVYTAQLLLNRGVKNHQEAISFLNIPNQLNMVPFDKEKSTAIGYRLLQAIEKKELITVHGDYDVDGVTGAAVLSQFLKSKGANFNYYLPDRFGDGYGLSAGTIERLAAQGTKIIITADCGISNGNEIELANKLGIEVIVTDHHTLPEVLPPATFIFHPGLVEDKAFHILSGVGTAYQLICDINEMIPSVYEVPTDEYLDLVTIGTIADISPLKGINRTMVQYGLTKIKNTRRLGLLTLMESAGINLENFSATDISFKIVPRLNAAGRMNRATIALELLLAETSEQAQELAKRLEELNKERQQLCEKTFAEIEEIISREINLETDKAIVIAGEGFHHGVIGILCSRIVDKYNRPAFVMAKEGEFTRGSARSNNLDLVEALRSAADLLVKFGGHKGAAGWSLRTENFEEFRRKILEYTSRLFAGQDMKAKLEVEVEIPLDQIDYKLYRELQELSPFGLDNPAPVIGIRGCAVDGQNLSKNGAHLFFNARGENKNFRTTFWNAAQFYPLEEKIDMIFNIVENNWRNKISLELKVGSIRKNFNREDMIKQKLSKMDREASIEIDFPVSQLIFKPVETGYLTNRLGSHQLNFPENICFNKSGLKITDYRSSASKTRDLEELFEKFGPQNISIYSSDKPDLPEKIQEQLKNAEINNPENGEKHLVIWDLPLKKEHFHHIINIVEAENIYMFYNEPAVSNQMVNGVILKEVLKNLYIFNENMTDFMDACYGSLQLSRDQLSHSLEFLSEAKFILQHEEKNFIRLQSKGIRLSELESYQNYLKEKNQSADFYNIMIRGSLNKISAFIGVNI